jgi:hypothetical protein
LHIESSRRRAAEGATAVNTWKFAGRRWVLLLAGSALAVLLPLTGCRRAASSDPKVAGPTESIRRALDRPLTAEFHDALWPDVLAELSRQSDVPIWLDRETVLRERGWDVTTWKATFKVRQMRLQSALRLLTAAPGVMYVHGPDGITITAERLARPNNEASLVSRAHAVPPGLAGGGPDADQRHLAGVLRRMIEPTSWQEAGGDGNVLSAPGALIVTQTPDNQRQVARLLTGLKRVAVDRQSWSLEEAESLESPALRAACEALARPVSLSVDGQPLGVVLDRLAAEQNVNIVWHGFREGGVYLGLPVSLSVDACPLRGALDRLLVQHDLVAEVHDDAVVIRTAASAPHTAAWRLYPTPEVDSWPERHTGRPRDTAEFIARHLSKSDSAAFSGPGDIVTIPGGVAARCRWAVHGEIDKYLEFWRQMEGRFNAVDGGITQIQGHPPDVPVSTRLP